MIFITVGTHEQPFTRLLVEIDKLIEEGCIKDEVFAQIGYSTYLPKLYKYKKMIGYDEMNKYIIDSDIIITHGGPGSIFQPIHYGKIPVVVPRNPKYKEHVDCHQILFVKKLQSENRVLAVYDIENLKNVIMNYKNLASKCVQGYNKKEEFIRKFDELVKSKFNLS